MTYDPDYVGRNLAVRVKQAVDKYQGEMSVIKRRAAEAGALHSSRTFIQFWEVGLATFERAVHEAIAFVYNATGQHVGEPVRQVRECARQIADGIIEETRRYAGIEDGAFGGGYSQIVDRMSSAMNEAKDRLLDDFEHGMSGSERLKKEPLVSVITNQTNSPGATQQVGIGENFSQSAFSQTHNELVTAIDRALISREFAQLNTAQKEAYSDTALVVKEEAAKTNPDAGKLQRWSGRLVDLGRDLGMKVATAEIVHLLAKIFGA